MQPFWQKVNNRICALNDVNSIDLILLYILVYSFSFYMQCLHFICANVLNV